MKLLNIFEKYFLLEDGNISSQSVLSKLQQVDLPFVNFFISNHLKQSLNNKRGRGSYKHLQAYSNFVDDLEKNKNRILEYFQTRKIYDEETMIVGKEEKKVPTANNIMLIGRIEKDYILKDNVGQKNPITNRMDEVYLDHYRVFAPLFLGSEGEDADKVAERYYELEKKIPEILDKLKEFEDMVKSHPKKKFLTTVEYFIETVSNQDGGLNWNRNKNILLNKLSPIREKFQEFLALHEKDMFSWATLKDKQNYTFSTIYVDTVPFQPANEELFYINDDKDLNKHYYLPDENGKVRKNKYFNKIPPGYERES